jgi:hypothetical protein
MKTNTITLETIIEAEFGNASIPKIRKILKKHHQYEFLINSIHQINLHITNKQSELKDSGMLNVGALAAIILTKFNQYLRELKGKEMQDDKKELEYLLGNISRRIIQLVLDEVPPTAKFRQLSNIVASLIDVCNIYKYDFFQLSTFLNVDELVRNVYVTQSKKEEPDINRQARVPGYRTCSANSKNKTYALIKLIIDLGICEEEEKLHKLFNKPKENLSIRFNEEDPVYVMQFWAALNPKHIIESDDPKFGFFQVLECHVINFKQYFMKGLSGKRAADSVRKRQDWIMRASKFDSHFKNINSSCQDEGGVARANNRPGKAA